MGILPAVNDEFPGMLHPRASDTRRLGKHLGTRSPERLRSGVEPTATVVARAVQDGNTPRGS